MAKISNFDEMIMMSALK